MIHNTYNILGTDWNSSSHNNHGGGKIMYPLFGSKKKKPRVEVRGKKVQHSQKYYKNQLGTDICVMISF